MKTRLIVIRDVTSRRHVEEVNLNRSETQRGLAELGDFGRSPSPTLPAVSRDSASFPPKY